MNDDDNNNEDMSEDSNKKNNLDKDDENEPDSKNSSIKNNIEDDLKIRSVTPYSSPIIPHKEPPKSFGFLDPLVSLFSKHDRSSSESDSSDSFEQPKKKVLKELTDFQKSFIQSQKENFDKNYTILKNDFRFLEEYESKIFKDTNLDIMFIMDLTGSMGIWLNTAKKNIKKIIEEIYDNNPGSKIRISFVGYKDFLDENEERKYDYIEFTENLELVNNFLYRLFRWRR